MKTFILFGRQLFQDGKLDWIAKARCHLAIEILKQNTASELIITGGKTTTQISEASVMKDYLIDKLPVDRRIILEESGLSTIHQLVLLKNNYLIPNMKFEVGLISDEIHMPRLELMAQHLLGDEFKITTYRAEVKISGHYRQAIEEYERRALFIIKNSPVILNYPIGDDKAWELYSEYYRNNRRGTGLIKKDINMEFSEYIQRVHPVNQ